MCVLFCRFQIICTNKRLVRKYIGMLYLATEEVTGSRFHHHVETECFQCGMLNKLDEKKQKNHHALGLNSQWIQSLVKPLRFINPSPSSDFMFKNLALITAYYQHQEKGNEKSGGSKSNKQDWVEKPHAGWLLYWVRASRGMAPALTEFLRICLTYYHVHLTQIWWVSDCVVLWLPGFQ